MIDKMMLDQSAGGIDRASMRDSMIGPVLCVVFKDQHDPLFPYRALAQVFHKLAHCQVIIRDIGKWRGLSPAQTGGMIIADADDIQLRYSACRHQRIEIRFPLAETGGIPYRKIPAREGCAIMSQQGADQRIGLT